jgi:thiamine biosynthesis lipoprotein
MRRARPGLGTLVEIGVILETGDDARAKGDGQGSDGQRAEAAIAAAFDRIAALESALSRFDPRSEIGRFNDAPECAVIPVGRDARHVLEAAARLFVSSEGLFDATQGSGPDAWSCDGELLRKAAPGVRLDLGGIAKGHAVDVGVATLRARGIGAGWVNAGGDLRAFGDVSLPVDVRDERNGGVRRFAWLSDGAFATSRLVIGAVASMRHVSVAAPSCLWADALTKVVALSGDVRHPAVRAHEAQAWIH